MTSKKKQKIVPNVRVFDKWLNILIAVIVALTALLGSYIAKIQGEAESEANLANHDEQTYYFDSIGVEMDGAANANYAYGTAYQLWFQYKIELKSAERANDSDTAQTLTMLIDSVTQTSGIFEPKYFNAETGEVKLDMYKGDLYIEKVYTLREKQKAASEVASQWNEKSNAYALQLSLLAVAGFLLGLALMAPGKIPRVIFTGSGVLLTFGISIWANSVYQIPVRDLRDTEAIQFFAKGANLADQKRWDEAIEMYTRAIRAAGEGSQYGHAHLRRAQSYAAIENYEKAIDDFKIALFLGENEPALGTHLSKAYYQTGDFNNAASAAISALEESPGDLWLHTQLAISLLAFGKIDEAQGEYQTLIEYATEQAEKKRGLGESPADIWWILDESAFQLEALAQTLESGQESVIKSHVNETEKVAVAANSFAVLLREKAVVIQFNLAGNSSGSIETPDFIFSTTSNGLFVAKVRMRINYSEIEEGTVVFIKTYHNGVPNPAWSADLIWEEPQNKGRFEISLNPGYSGASIVPPGSYKVDIYINGKFAQGGSFVIGNPFGDEADFPTSMLENFDIYSEGFTFDDDDDIDEFSFDDPFFILDITDEIEDGKFSDMSDDEFDPVGTAGDDSLDTTENEDGATGDTDGEADGEDEDPDG